MTAFNKEPDDASLRKKHNLFDGVRKRYRTRDERRGNEASRERFLAKQESERSNVKPEGENDET